MVIDDALWAAWACVAGPVVGSFLGLVSLRLPQGRPVLVSRSACDGCGRRLGPADLVPIVSFVVLRGRCRTCRAPIPKRYLAFEIAALAVAAWAVWVHPGPLGLATAGLGWWLLLLGALDAEHFWLPDAVTLPLLGFGLVVSLALEPSGWATPLIGAASGFLFFTGLAAAYRRLRGREGLGGGDARLLAAAGAWVGWIGLPSVLLWACAAGLAVVAGRAAGGRTPRGDEAVPFGVFLSLGLWLTWLYGPIGR